LGIDLAHHCAPGHVALDRHVVARGKHGCDGWHLDIQRLTQDADFHGWLGQALAQQFAAKGLLQVVDRNQGVAAD
jgi:hypothetical protein